MNEPPQAHIVRQFFDLVPYNKALGMELVELGPGEAVFRLPWSEKLVGDPRTGLLHGGAITGLTDACAGAAVFLALRDPVPVATLDLRIDYLRPGHAERDVLARAHCYRVTRNVAFVRCTAYHEDDPEHPLAAVAATFMLATAAGRGWTLAKEGS